MQLINLIASTLLIGAAVAAPVSGNGGILELFQGKSSTNGGTCQNLFGSKKCSNYKRDAAALPEAVSTPEWHIPPPPSKIKRDAEPELNQPFIPTELDAPVGKKLEYRRSAEAEAEAVVKEEARVAVEFKA